METATSPFAQQRGSDFRTAARDVRLNLLEGFELRCQGEVVAIPLTSQRLVAYLALHERPLLRMHVAGVLWPDATEEHARGNLRSALWRLNRPGLPLVHATSSHLRLAEHVVVDVQETTVLAQGVLRQCRDDFDFDTADLVRDILPDWYEDWLLVARERFRQIRLHALESLCESLTGAKRFAQAAEAGLAAVAGEPLRESAHRALVKLHLAEGNHSEAVRQYRLYARLLNAELGIEPSPLLHSLVKELL